MKKILLLLVVTIIIYIFYFPSRNEQKQKLTKVSDKRAEKIIQKKIELKPKLKNIHTKKIIPKKLDINKMHPCDALHSLSKHQAPWSFLSKSNHHNLYTEVMDLVEEKTKSKSLTEKQRVALYTKMDNFSNTNYIPYLEEIYKKVKLSNNNSRLAEKIKSRLMHEFDFEPSLELQLSKAKFLLHQDKMADSIFILNNIAEDDSLFNSNGLERLYKNLYQSASTPSEISAAIETASRAPTYDFTFLLEIKKKYGSQSVDKILDKVALKLINRTLSTKSALAVDYLSYDIAIRLHSRGEIIAKKYGTRDEIVKKFLSKNNIDSSQACDDREIISLCEKYCRK